MLVEHLYMKVRANILCNFTPSHENRDIARFELVVKVLLFGVLTGFTDKFHKIELHLNIATPMFGLVASLMFSLGM